MFKTQQNVGYVGIEAMEQRVLFDVSLLTETIDSSTLPAAVSDHMPLKGTVTVTVANNSGEDVKANAAIGVFISNGPLDVPSGVYGVLGSHIGTLKLLDGTSKTLVIQVHVAKGRLADGVDTLTAVVAEPEGGFSQSVPGGTLTVHPPIVTLSETETFLKLADSASTGAKFKVSDQVAITNSGTDPSTDPLTIGIFATPDGIPADGSQMTSVVRRVTIKPNQTVIVPVNVSAIPKLAAGSYKLITQVDDNGVVTTTDPSTAPVVTLAAPTTGPNFSDSIIAQPTEVYTSEPLIGYEEYLSTLTLKMSIDNTGTAVTGSDFTLFVSNNTTFDSSAIAVGQVSLDSLAVPHNGVRTFFISFNLTQDLNDVQGASDDMYIYVQVKDPTGNITMASYPTAIKVSGNTLDG